jgi:hypothetical protein
MATHHVKDPNSGLMLPPEFVNTERLSITPEERAKRLKYMETHFTTAWRIPLKAVYLRYDSMGAMHHEYIDRQYYMLGGPDGRARIGIAMTAAKRFQAWERQNVNEDWPQVAGDVEAVEINNQEWRKAFTEATNGKWWRRVAYLLPNNEAPVIPVAFTYLTDSAAAKLQTSPDNYVNIDNLYKREKY